MNEGGGEECPGFGASERFVLGLVYDCFPVAWAVRVKVLERVDVRSDRDFKKAN